MEVFTSDTSQTYVKVPYPSHGSSIDSGMYELVLGLLLVKLKSSLRKFYGRHHGDDLVNRYGTSVSQMITDMFHLS